MDEISLTLISRALEGLNQRYLYTAQNIANANTPNYQPVRVSFEENLQAAAQRGRAAIDAVEPQVFVEDTSDAGPMRLDLELETAQQTASRYRALVDILSRQMALQRAIAQPGS